MNDPLQRRAMLGFIAIAAGALACRRAFGGNAAQRDCEMFDRSAQDDDARAAAPLHEAGDARAHPLSAASARRRRLLDACRAAAR